MTHVTIDSLQFDTSCWRLVSESAAQRLWQTMDGDQMSLHLFELRPDIAAPLADVAAVRSAYRSRIVEAGAALVSADVETVAGLRAVTLIIKQPQQPTGMTYLASLTLPFQRFSYVVKVQCPELGITGLRDTLIFSAFMANRAQDEDRDPLEGWMCDPYDPKRKDRLMRNQSENEQYDIQFPHHPLSRARRYLASIAPTIRLDEAVLREPAYEP